MLPADGNHKGEEEVVPEGQEQKLRGKETHATTKGDDIYIDLDECYGILLYKHSSDIVERGHWCRIL
jgi:hypothetical protein